MNDIIKRTITTLEVAEMMEIEHWKLLRKLDGDKKSIGIIKILTGNNFVVSDYFILSTYKDASGKENKCYEVTKLGCDFLANKFTGEKGVIFTAKYVKKFNEMEVLVNRENKSQVLDQKTTFKEVVETIPTIVKDLNINYFDVRTMYKTACKEYGISESLIPDIQFSKIIHTFPNGEVRDSVQGLTIPYEISEKIFNILNRHKTFA